MAVAGASVVLGMTGAIAGAAVVGGAVAFLRTLFASRRALLIRSRVIVIVVV